jgi:hypothetical protein
LLAFDLSEAVALLARTPHTLVALLGDLPPHWAHARENEDAWSPFDVVGHLIHGEKTDWMPRARIILEYGESRAFDPFDRFAQFEASQGKSLSQLLDDFSALRRENIAALRAMNLQPADFARKGRHPELGEVTLGQLIATWAAHDLDHSQQIVRTLARQYTTEVGPWQAYLGVLND